MTLADCLGENPHFSPTHIYKQDKEGWEVKVFLRQLCGETSRVAIVETPSGRVLYVPSENVRPI